jgi:NTE family protein
MSKNGRGSEDGRIALVIGSGAAKCAAALGLWKVLSREGIHIDLFVGCSGG